MAKGACNMDKLLNKYAELVVRTGVNLQPQQLLVINSPIECSDFARRVAEAAFEAGAKDVKVIWSDERLARIRWIKQRQRFLMNFLPGAGICLWISRLREQQ